MQRSPRTLRNSNLFSAGPLQSIVPSSSILDSTTSLQPHSTLPQNTSKPSQTFPTDQLMLHFFRLPQLWRSFEELCKREMDSEGKPLSQHIRQEEFGSILVSASWYWGEQGEIFWCLECWYYFCWELADLEQIKSKTRKTRKAKDDSGQRRSSEILRWGDEEYFAREAPRTATY